LLRLKSPRGGISIGRGRTGSEGRNTSKKAGSGEIVLTALKVKKSKISGMEVSLEEKSINAGAEALKILYSSENFVNAALYQPDMSLENR